MQKDSNISCDFRRLEEKKKRKKTGYVSIDFSQTTSERVTGEEGWRDGWRGGGRSP